MEFAPTALAFREHNDADAGTQRAFIANESVEDGKELAEPGAVASASRTLWLMAPRLPASAATQHFRKGERVRCATMHTQPLNDEQCLE